MNSLMLQWAGITDSEGRLPTSDGASNIVH
jgi:hypothetical protein